MNSQPSLVEYRRTSSDMDMSSSEEESNNAPEIQSTQSQLERSDIPYESTSSGQEQRLQDDQDTRNDQAGAESAAFDKSTRNSHSSREDRGRSRDEKPRDERRENGQRDHRLRDYDRERKERKKDYSEGKRSERSSSPDRRKRRSPERSRGRSPHHDKSHHRRRSRSPGRKKHSPDRRDRKRSHSPDHRFRKFPRSSRSPETFRSKRLERKAAKIDKLGLELFAEAKSSVLTTLPPREGESSNLASFYNAGAANPAARLTEQIQKRRLLWGAKKETPPVGEPVVDAAGSSKAWQAATFKGDNDGKMTEKFKRLMGIKGEGTAAPPEGSTLIQKQEEMFSNMEAQYQVARMATHTHRGIGLGFGTFQVPPR